MRLAEIRDLDGPNYFLLEPAIKIELVVDDPSELKPIAERLGEDAEVAADLTAFGAAGTAFLRRLDPAVRTTARWLETPDHIVIAFSWAHRRAALASAELFVKVATGEAIDLAAEGSRIAALAETIESDDVPMMVSDAERRVPIVGITGTNGKTTTTRLLAHILMHAGKRVGWSSSSGVYIQGQEVIAGDYSGPSGARRVLQEPDLDVAVLETARGGILLRGVAYEHNDVGVLTNISADHLDLQGIRTVEALARAKSVVIRVTKPDGVVVANADDPLVMHEAMQTDAPKLLFARSIASPNVDRHLQGGGTVVTRADDDLIVARGSERETVVSLADVPIAFGGRAGHMVENAMAATGAALGLGLDVAAIRAGLTTFRSDAEFNPGRLNVFELNGVHIVLDYAHNEAGLAHLLAFARTFLGPDGRLTVSIGTAGDRTDDSLRALGRMAAEQADQVIIKLTRKYLRGREEADIIAKYQEGIRAGGKPESPVAETELDGVRLALETARVGDVIATMCQIDMEAITGYVLHLGGHAL